MQNPGACAEFGSLTQVKAGKYPPPQGTKIRLSRLREVRQHDMLHCNSGG